MRYTVEAGLVWQRTAECADWCADHGLRQADVLAICFGAIPPKDMDLPHVSQYARVTLYQRDSDGRRLLEGSRGRERLKLARPRWVAIRWWPKTIGSRETPEDGKKP